MHLGVKDVYFAVCSEGSTLSKGRVHAKEKVFQGHSAAALPFLIETLLPLCVLRNGWEPQTLSLPSSRLPQSRHAPLPEKTASQMLLQHQQHLGGVQWAPRNQHPLPPTDCSGSGRASLRSRAWDSSGMSRCSQHCPVAPAAPTGPLWKITFTD